MGGFEARTVPVRLPVLAPKVKTCYNNNMKNKKAQTTYQRQVASDRKAAARDRAAEREANAVADLDALLDDVRG